jgi:hypothetical protein
MRIAAVRAEPAEAAPGEAVALSALIVGPAGEKEDAAIDWAFCNQQKPLGDLADVASACFVYQADYLVPLGQGPAAQGKVPAQACGLFGPDVPPAKPGQPPGRPADPDPSGGYYQPVRLVVPDDGGPVIGAGEARLACGLPGATSETLQAFGQRYRRNENPSLGGLWAVSQGNAALTPDTGAGPALTVAPGTKVTLRASWPACPAQAACGDGVCSPGEDEMGCAADCKVPHGCGGAEAYVYYEPDSQGLVDRREAITVSWLATGGTFFADRSERAEKEVETFVEDDWTAPDQADDVTLWVVLRDDRGGVGWNRYRISVR